MKKLQRSKVNLPTNDSNPIHKLSTAAMSIININRQAMIEAGRKVNGVQVILPIWIIGENNFKITIETGPDTEAEYAIFKAQTK